MAGGLVATGKRLVPYGAMTATFYTGLGCLLGPSVFYFSLRLLLGGWHAAGTGESVPR